MTHSSLKRVLFVGRPVVWRGLCRLIEEEPELEMCAVATCEAEALAFARFFHPDVALVDVDLEGVRGTALISQLRAYHADLPVLASSLHRPTTIAERARTAGAQGYISKQMSSEEVLRALRCVLEGRHYVNRETRPSTREPGIDLYRRFVESVREYAIIMLDTEGRIRTWNAGAQDTLGYEKGEIVGAHAAILYAEEDRKAGILEKEMQTAAEKGCVNDDYWLQRKDGSRFWASGTLRALRGPEDELLGFTKILRDLTERKRLEEELEARMEQRTAELRRKETRQRAMLAALPDIILRLSEEGRIEDAHVPDPSKLLPADELTGRSFREVLPEEAARQLGEAFETVLETSHPARTELRLAGRDGQERTYEIRLSPANGGVLVLKRDISERRRLEREVLEISEREYRRLARELHDDLSQQLMGAQYLIRSLRRRLAKEASSHVDKLTEISEEIDKAIDYTRNISHGLAAIDVENGRGLDGALQRLAHRVTDTFEVACLYESKGPDYPKDETIATHLYRIVQEAVNNAVRHARASEITIRRRVSNEELTLSIEDDGVGISDEALESEDGLGLRSIRYRTDLIGAQLNIRRRPEGGTAVTCSLPRRSWKPT